MASKGKINVASIRSRIAAVQTDIANEVERAAQEAGVRGERQFENMLFAAETETGIDRVEFGRGPFSGRVETGALIESTGHEVTRKGNSRISLRYGAINNPPDYAGEQLHGTDKIEPAISPVTAERDIHGTLKDENLRELRADIRAIGASGWKVRL